MDLSLGGNIAVITGAGRGIGRAIALRLAGEGASIVVNDIHQEVIDQLTGEVGSLGREALGVKADVTETAQVEDLVAKTLDRFGRLDILINNAGIVYSGEAPAARKLFTETTAQDWRRDLDLILLGTLNCCRAALPPMIQAGHGRIVNIASDLGRTSMGLKKMTIYSAAKGGVIAFTRSLAQEVAEFGVTVNCVTPGLIQTTRAQLAEEMKDSRPEEYGFFKEIERKLVEDIPLGRIGLPDDVAALTVFLASGAAAWITGQTMSVNGGQVMI